MSPAIVLGFDLLGLVLIGFGALRLIVARRLAEKRAATGAATMPDRDRYVRGLTDFYRLTGSLVIFAGVVLVLVLNFAR